MSNVYSEIEDAVKAMFLADDWFKVAAGNVTTIETDIREALFPEWDVAGAYHTSELPAVMILAGLENSKEDQTAVNEITYQVPVKTLCFTAASGAIRARKQAARNAAQEMAGQAERALNACRTSEAALAVSGRGNMLRDVTSVTDLVDDETTICYGIAEVDALVVVVKDL